ncbi:hypothetical protein [Streptomyces sp. NPDC058066]|uniref:hypothetical protein n=1 Tax=Streptomyces sp. NPDC058066 TaxID=3346323 RepID=UPI0036E8A763
MPVVTLFHADAPPLVMSRWHPIGWTEALAQCRHSRAMARIDGVSGTCADELPDHVPAKSEDCGGAGSVQNGESEVVRPALAPQAGLCRCVRAAADAEEARLDDRLRFLGLGEGPCGDVACLGRG